MKKIIIVIAAFVLIPLVVISLFAGASYFYMEGTNAILPETINLIVKNAILKSYDPIIVSGIESGSSNTIDVKMGFLNIEVVDLDESDSDKYKAVIECQLEGDGYISEARHQMELIISCDEQGDYYLETAKVMDEQPVIIKKTETNNSL